MAKYNKVALGGTFDRLHNGHRKLLSLAVSLADKLVVGLTSDEFVKNKMLSSSIQKYIDRKNELEAALMSNGATEYEIIKLDDVYGSSLKDKQIEALVVSKQTIAGANEINKQRIKLGLAKLPVEVAKMVSDEDGEYLSSTRIRQGVVNRVGRVYRRVFLEDIYLTNDQLAELKEPAGRLFRGTVVLNAIDTKRDIILVGDQVVSEAIKSKIVWNLAIIDRKIARHDYENKINLSGFRIEKGINDPGTISHNVVDKMRKLAEEDNVVLEVVGEEDLLVLPAILLCRLGCQVVYGQPNEGFVVIDVDEQTKDKWYGFLGR